MNEYFVEIWSGFLLMRSCHGVDHRSRLLDFLSTDKFPPKLVKISLTGILKSCIYACGLDTRSNIQLNRFCTIVKFRNFHCDIGLLHYQLANYQAKRMASLWSCYLGNPNWLRGDVCYTIYCCCLVAFLSSNYSLKI